MNLIELRDKLVGTIQYEWLSRLCLQSELVAKHVVGDNPVQWYVSSRPAKHIDWLNLERDSNASRDPRPIAAREAAVLRVPQARLLKLAEAKQQGRTIVPLEIVTGGRFIKLRIAVGQGKKRYDKRQTIKAREQGRAIQRSLRA